MWRLASSAAAITSGEMRVSVGLTRKNRVVLTLIIAGLVLGRARTKCHDGSGVVGSHGLEIASNAALALAALGITIRSWILGYKEEERFTSRE